MTKKQNRIRGFGKRSLSVILAMLIVLSTMVVMLTSTMLTSHAAISYWYLVGDFNGWNINDETYKLNMGGNVNIPPNAANGFKAIAVENGNRIWNGLDGATSMAMGSDKKLNWGGGNNIKFSNSPENPTSYTVYIYQSGQENHISVVANTVPVESGSKNIGKTFTTQTPVAPGNTDGDGIFWAKATYYDYISDWEHGHTNWLKPIKAGTGHNWSNDEWYPFFGINGVISNYYSGKSAYPLYFGNFCYTQGAYDTSGHHYGTNNGYNTAISGLTNFKYAVNNSNKDNYSSGTVGGTGLQNYNQSYQGLMNTHLGSNGELLMAGSNTEAPYFNKAALGDYVNVVESAFPFRVTDNGAYKTYQFNSTDGQDNVYFTWAQDGNSTRPTSVHYGSYDFKVKDGIEHFMHNESSGYGIFPFNNGSSVNKGTKYNTNDNLDYGFGVKMEVKFRVPKPNESTGVNTGANPIKFDFSGDDDMWMYITDDETGASYLVLDMGGNHKQSSGSVDFNKLTSKVDHVYQGNNTTDRAVEKSFLNDIGLDFDYNKTYTMTVFYMERGLIESNCEMTFSMYPAGNQVNVEKEVNTANINHTSSNYDLANAVASLDTFGFTALQSQSASGVYTQLKNTEYMHNYYGNRKTGSTGLFNLKDSEMASFLSQYTTNNYVQIVENIPTGGSNKLSYTTKWSVTDPKDSSRNLTNQTGLQTTKLQLKNPSGDPNDYAQLDYKFVNTPNVGHVSVTKSIPGASTADKSQQFNAKVEVSLNGTSGPFVAYPLTYSASDISGRTFETSASGMLSSSALLKAGRTLTFRNLPTNAVVRVTEQLTNAQKALYQASYQGGRNAVTVPNGSTSAITVVNTPITPDSVKGFINGFKLLDNTNYTGDMFKFIEEGVARSAGDPANIIDTSGIHDETTSVDENSVFRFSDLTFDKEGIYRYHVYEDTSYLTTPDTTFDTDFTGTKTHYLVEFTVTKQSNKLVVGYPVYYAYTPTGNPITSADFDPAKEEPSLIIFNNLEKGNLRIEKENQKGEKVKDVEFAVYEVDEDMQLIIDGRQSGAQKYDSMITYINANGIQKAGSGVTGQDGVATINNLPIYKDNFVKATKVSGINHLTVNRAEFTGYKKYILLELASTGTAGYSINKTIGAPNGTINANNVFSFPINSQYDFTFSFVNNQLKNPSTAGSGMTLFKILGMGLAALSILALGGYLLYTKKAAKRKAPKHVMK